MAHATAWHTVGPFFPRTFFRDGDNDLANTGADAPPAQGEVMLLRGIVRQDGGAPAVNAVIEAWQADANGRFRHPRDPAWQLADPGFFGWGRAWTDGEGRYEFRTVMPGGYGDAAGLRAPHVNLSVLASGIMRRLHTTVFFPGQPGNAADPVLACVPEDARPLLIAREAPSGAAGLRVFTFDITLRGERETPFFVD